VEKAPESAPSSIETTQPIKVQQEQQQASRQKESSEIKPVQKVAAKDIFKSDVKPLEQASRPKVQSPVQENKSTNEITPKPVAAPAKKSSGSGFSASSAAQNSTVPAVPKQVEKRPVPEYKKAEIKQVITSTDPKQSAFRISNSENVTVKSAEQSD
jgi:glucan-binding YG repeat protein